MTIKITVVKSDLEDECMAVQKLRNSRPYG